VASPARWRSAWPGLVGGVLELTQSSGETWLGVDWPPAANPRFLAVPALDHECFWGLLLCSCWVETRPWRCCHLPSPMPPGGPGSVSDAARCLAHRPPPGPAQAAAPPAAPPCSPPWDQACARAFSYAGYRLDMRALRSATLCSGVRARWLGTNCALSLQVVANFHELWNAASAAAGGDAVARSPAAGPAPPLGHAGPVSS